MLSLATNPALLAIRSDVRTHAMMRAMSDAIRMDHERTERLRRVHRIATIADTIEHGRRIAEKLRSRNRRHARKVEVIRANGVMFSTGRVVRPIA